MKHGLQHWGKCVPQAIATKACLCELACGGGWNFESETYRHLISCMCHIENCAKACHTCAYSLTMSSICAFTHEQVMHCRDCCNRCVESCSQSGEMLYREGKRRIDQLSPSDRESYASKHNACMEMLRQLVQHNKECIRECDIALNA